MHARPQCRKDQLPLQSHRDLGLRFFSTSISKMGTEATPRGRAALEDMGKYHRHVSYFKKLDIILLITIPFYHWVSLRI